MTKRGEQPDDLQFTLEEIIAEVKSEQPAAKPAGTAAPKNSIDIDLSAPDDELEKWLTGKAKHPPRRAPRPAAPRAADQTSLFPPEPRAAEPTRPAQAPTHAAEPTRPTHAPAHAAEPSAAAASETRIYTPQHRRSAPAEQPMRPAEGRRETVAEPQRRSSAPAEQPVRPTESRREAAAEPQSAPQTQTPPRRPPEHAAPAARPAAPESAYAGRHAAAQQPSEGEQLLADLDALSAPAAPVRQAAAPPETPQAPWRTRPRRPEPEPEKAPEPEEPDEEPEEETEEPRPPRPKIPYDLANIPYEDAGEAADQMQSRLASLSSRMLLMLPVLITSLYMTVCAPLGLPMPFGFTYTAYPFFYQLAFSGLQVLALLIAAPVTASGLWRLLRLRPTLDTVVLFAGLCSLAHSVSVVLRPAWGGYLPYTCVSVLTCFFALQQKRQRASALRRSYKAVVMGTVPTGIKLQIDGNRIATAVKTAEGGHAEVVDLAEPDTTERFSEYYAPVVMVLCLVFAAVASFGKGAPTRMLWALAAISSVSAPVCLLLSASAPAVRLSKKLFASGSTLVSGQTAKQLAKTRALVLEDADLFPAGAVTLAGMKVADNQTPDRVIACAAAMLQEIGGGLSRTFTELARQQYIAPLRAEELRFFETGGISARIGDSYALLGSVNFLARMGVRVTEGLQLKNSLFLALDGSFAGIFTLRYSVQPPVYSAFGLLRRAHIQPVLALRDFTTTQAFVESHFDLRTDSTEFPVLSERLRMSAPSFARELPTLALLSRDGLLPAAETLAAARQLTRAARTGRWLGLFAAGAGILLLYFLCWRGAYAAAAPYNVVLYLLLWALPADLFSRVSTRL